MDEKEIVRRIHDLYPDAAVDINGEGCNFEIFVISDEFQGVPQVKRQQALMQLFADELASGKMHALGIKAKTHAELAASNSHLVQLQM